MRVVFVRAFLRTRFLEKRFFKMSFKGGTGVRSAFGGELTSPRSISGADKREVVLERTAPHATISM